MTIFYHVTPLKNVKKILREGLKPGGSRGMTDDWWADKEPSKREREKSKLHFMPTLEDAGELLEDFASSGFGNQWGILAVDIQDTDNLHTGGNYGELPMSYIYKGRIPPSSIRYMGRVVTKASSKISKDLVSPTEAINPSVGKLVQGSRLRSIDRMAGGLTFLLGKGCRLEDYLEEGESLPKISGAEKKRFALLRKEMVGLYRNPDISDKEFGDLVNKFESVEKSYPINWPYIDLEGDGISYEEKIGQE